MTGGDGVEFEELIYEGYGPGGHPTEDQRDYSIAWEDPPEEFTG